MQIENHGDTCYLPAGTLVLRYCTALPGDEQGPEVDDVIIGEIDLDGVTAYLAEEAYLGRGYVFRIDSDPEDEEGASTLLYRFDRGGWSAA